ncbi:hypothetical protein [Spiroplasma endosymbiont of Labia minor]|uniref:hypothetical protein n=1 Tax=Spiroplasma endosymbiont of Labia minor TaxID=3066305 RepID=UPI0030D0B530
MKELTNVEMNHTIGGASISGSFISGIADIIDSITGFTEAIAGIVFEFTHSNQINGPFQNGDVKFTIDNSSNVNYNQFA